MNENAITTKLINKLKTLTGCYARKQHGGMFSSGDPDALICFRGKLVWVEVKVDGGKLSALQAEQMQRWQNAGALVMLAVYNYKDKTFKVFTAKNRWADFALINVDKIMNEACNFLRVDAIEWAAHFERHTR